MKKVLKIVWRLVPWYLAFRGLYDFCGITFNRVRCMTKTDSMGEFVSTAGIDSVISETKKAAETMVSRVHSGWKWMFKK